MYKLFGVYLSRDKDERSHLGAILLSASFILARVPIFIVSKQRTTNRQSHHNTSLCLHFQFSGSWSYSVHTEWVLVYTRPSTIRRTETVNTSWYFGAIALIWRCVRSRGGRWIMDPEFPCFCQFKSYCLYSSCFPNLNNPPILKKWRPTYLKEFEGRHQRIVFPGKEWKLRSSEPIKLGPERHVII